jgi:hypothetical protein
LPFNIAARVGNVPVREVFDGLNIRLGYTGPFEVFVAFSVPADRS